MSELERLARLLDESQDPENPPPRVLRQLLERVHTVAVVGLSRHQEKPARRVPAYLATKGYRVIPVNPFAERILSQPARATLDEVAEPVDLVLVFRPSAEAGGVIRDAAGRPERPAIWLQEGILATEAAREARESGLIVVQDLCIFKAHRSITANAPAPPWPPPRGAGLPPGL